MPRARASTTRLAPLGRRKKQPSHFDDPRGRVARRRLTADAGAPRQAWARELSATLRAERQRNEARALVGASSAADEFRCSAALFNVLSDLPRADASRPFEDGRTLAHLAFERGAVFMLAAYLRAGGEWTPPTVRGPTFEKHGAKLAACRALVRGWPGNRADVARHCVVGRSHATDLAVFLRFGDVGVKSSALARKRALLAYVAWMRRRAAAGALTLRGRDVLERAPELRGSQVHGRAARLLAGAAPERPSSPRCKTPRSRTAQIMRRSGVKLQVLPADDRPAPSPEIARWLADRGLGNILALRARPGSPAAAGETAEAPEPAAASPRADDLECAICLSLLSDPVYTPCLHVFCSRCLRAALLRATASRRKCPLCRADLPSEAPRRCGGKILHSISKLRGDRTANIYHPCLDVRVLGSRVAASFAEAREMGADLRNDAVALSEIRGRARALATALDMQQIALAVAVLCHPLCEPRVSLAVAAYL